MFRSCCSSYLSFASCSTMDLPSFRLSSSSHATTARWTSSMAPVYIHQPCKWRRKVDYRRTHKYDRPTISCRDVGKGALVRGVVRSFIHIRHATRTLGLRNIRVFVSNSISIRVVTIAHSYKKCVVEDRFMEADSTSARGWSALQWLARRARLRYPRLAYLVISNCYRAVATQRTQAFSQSKASVYTDYLHS